MTRKIFSTTLTAVATTAALMLSGAPAWSQTSTASSTKSAAASSVSKGDSKLLGDLAQANMAEVAAGQLALDKSPNDDTKKFAQMMIDDHSKALDEVKKLADSKGVTLPTEPSIGQRTEATALKALSGNLFDKEYRSHAGVGDHQRTVKLLNKIQKDAKDPDIKALADKMLPTVQGHLAMAKDLNAKKKG